MQSNIAGNVKFSSKALIIRNLQEKFRRLMPALEFCQAKRTHLAILHLVPSNLVDLSSVLVVPLTNSGKSPLTLAGTSGSQYKRPTNRYVGV